MFAELYNEPRTFLENSMTFGRINKPAYVVTVLALVNLLQVAAVFQHVGEMYFEVEGGLFLLAGVYFIQPFLIWVLVAAVAWLIANVLGGHVRFNHLLKGFGWGMFPLIGTSICWALARYLALAGSVPPDPIGFGVVVEMRALGEWVATHAVGDPAFVALTVVGALFVLPAAYIWTLAVNEASQLDIRNSAIVVAVPVVAYLYWAITPLL